MVNFFLFFSFLTFQAKSYTTGSWWQPRSSEVWKRNHLWGRTTWARNCMDARKDPRWPNHTGGKSKCETKFPAMLHCLARYMDNWMNNVFGHSVFLINILPFFTSYLFAIFPTSLPEQLIFYPLFSPWPVQRFVWSTNRWRWYVANSVWKRQSECWYSACWVQLFSRALTVKSTETKAGWIFSLYTSTGFQNQAKIGKLAVIL